MSNALQTVSLLDSIRQAILAAWPGITVDYGKPRTKRLAPYSIVYWERVAVSFGGTVGTVGGTTQENKFSILGRFPFPSDPTLIIDLQKVLKANALIADLQSGSTFGGVGMMPLVTSVDATEPDDPNEKVYEVSLSFSVVTQGSHS